MIVAGIDPSLTSTGVCVVRDGQPVVLRSIGYTGNNADCWRTRGRRIVKQVRGVMPLVVQQGVPDLAVIEGPDYGDNMPSTFDRSGLWWGLFCELWARNIPVAVVAPASRAKWATGKGRISDPALTPHQRRKAHKRLVLDEVQRWWPNVKVHNDDMADAAAMAMMGALRGGDPMPFLVRGRHMLGLEAVAWPAEAFQ